MFEIVLKDRKFTEHKEAGEFLRGIIEHSILYEELTIGAYKGFEIALKKDSEGAILYVKGNGLYKVELKKSDSGNIVRLENTVNGLDKEAEEIRQKIAGYHTEMENAKIEYEKEFQYEDLLKEKLKRQRLKRKMRLLTTYRRRPWQRRISQRPQDRLQVPGQASFFIN